MTRAHSKKHDSSASLTHKHDEDADTAGAGNEDAARNAAHEHGAQAGDADDQEDEALQEGGRQGGLVGHLQGGQGGPGGGSGEGFRRATQEQACIFPRQQGAPLSRCPVASCRSAHSTHLGAQAGVNASAGVVAGARVLGGAHLVHNLGAVSLSGAAAEGKGQHRQSRFSAKQQGLFCRRSPTGSSSGTPLRQTQRLACRAGPRRQGWTG